MNTPQTRAKPVAARPPSRLLTLAELDPGETLQAYREQVLASRLGRLNTGTPEQKTQLCEGALSHLQSMAQGTPLPGEWPPRQKATKAKP